MALLKRPDCNFLDVLSEGTFEEFKSLVSALVLGTDVADDNFLRESFECRLEDCGDTAFTPRCAADRVLALQISLKCADLGHLASDWSTHREWVSRLEEEFFLQGDQERKLGFEK